jgi:hypothetical protein
MKTNSAFFAAALVCAGALAGFGLKSVFADGIPTTTPLFYSGTLSEAGQLVNGMRPMTITLWANAAPTAGEGALCTTTAASVPVVDGRFRIPLDAGCVAAIHANADTYIEAIDNGVSLGRAKNGAVPYAIEAAHAVSASSAADGGPLATTLTTLQGQTHAPSAFAAIRSTAQSIPTKTVTTVLYDTVQFELAGEYSSSTGQFTPKAAGVYLVQCSRSFLDRTSFSAARLY